MIFKKIQPTTNSLRSKLTIKFKLSGFHKNLQYNYNSLNGRNNSGKITVRHKGGSNKFLFRNIDYKNCDIYLPGILIGFTRDIFKTCWIGLIKYTNGTYKYIILPHKSKIGDIIKTNLNQSNLYNLGDRTFLKNIKTGTIIHNIEKVPFQGGKLIRAAGCYGKISRINNKIRILLPSKKYIYCNQYCLASIGRISNIYHNLEKFGKAGEMYIFNKRPTVRGAAMNACDHPHGGRTGSRRRTKTPWGKIIKK